MKIIIELDDTVDDVDEALVRLIGLNQEEEEEQEEEQVDTLFPEVSIHNYPVDEGG